MKLVSGEWPGFFYDFLPIVGGALFEGKRPFKVLIAGPTTLTNFVASTFPLSGFFGACPFFVFLFRFFLPRFRLSVCSKPYAQGAARRGDFLILIAGPTTLNNLCCHDFRELWVWACDAAARPAMLCAMVTSNFLSAAW